MHSKPSESTLPVVLRCGEPYGGALPAYLGMGLFETMRVRAGHSPGEYRIFGLAYHLERLVHGCEILRIKPPLGEQVAHCIQAALCGRVLTSDLVLRIVVFPDEWFLQLDQFKPRFGASATLLSVSLERSLPQLKSCSALTSLYAQQLARARGFDEALLCDRKGVVREGAWSNFFWVRSDGTVCTPASRILLGVTRRMVIERLGAEGVQRIDVPLAIVLHEAHEAFLTNALQGIVPVQAIDAHTLTLGKFARAIRTLYENSHHRANTSDTAHS